MNMSAKKTLKTMLFRCAPLFLLIAAAAPSAKPVQSYDSYKSWLIVCDNTLACLAKGFSEDNADAEIIVARDAGLAGTLAIAIRAEAKFGFDDVQVDGVPVRLPKKAWRLNSSDGETSLTTSDLDAARALVQRLRIGTKVTLGAAGEVPLEGFTATMLKLDERQGRVGTVTALVKVGPIPVSHVPPAPPLPRIANHPITATLKAGEERRLLATVRANQQALLRKEDCEAHPTAMEAEAHALDAGRALVIIPCIMGAYQGSSLAFIAPRGGGPAQRLIAPTPYGGNDADRSNADFFTESGFDSKTGTLSMAAKGRGLADCGMSASWIWDGNSFHLSDMTLQKSCGGVSPGDWPTLFRSVQ
jgi:hypothetical protein